MYIYMYIYIYTYIYRIQHELMGIELVRTTISQLVFGRGLLQGDFLKF